MLGSLGSLLISVLVRVIKYVTISLLMMLLTLSVITDHFPPRLESIKQFVQKIKNFSHIVKSAPSLRRSPTSTLSSSKDQSALDPNSDEQDVVAMEDYFKKRAALGAEFGNTIKGDEGSYSSQDIIKKQNEQINQLSDNLKRKEQEIYQLKLQIGRMQKQLAHP